MRHKGRRVLRAPCVRHETRGVAKGVVVLQGVWRVLRVTPDPSPDKLDGCAPSSASPMYLEAAALGTVLDPSPDKGAANP